MSIFYEGPNFFASGRLFLVDRAEKFCQELATLLDANTFCGGRLVSTLFAYLIKGKTKFILNVL
jgi:hypothetical protein